MVRKSAPDSSRWVAKQCRRGCGCSGLLMPARWADSRQACQTTLSLMGGSATRLSDRGLKQMGGEAMPQGVRMQRLADAGALGGFAASVPDNLVADGGIGDKVVRSRTQADGWRSNAAGCADAAAC